MKIIYLSGIDGCGKTTQAKLLVDLLQKKGLNVKYIWFRWEPSFRKPINAFRLLKKRPAEENQQLHEKENAEHKDWLKFKQRILKNPIIRMGWLYYACADYYYSYKNRFVTIAADVVVIDRYINDFIIDQAINLDISPEEMRVISNNYFLKNFHYPDFSTIIDLPASEGYTRKSDGTPLSYLETREKYYATINTPPTLHLDGLKSVDELASEIGKWVVGKLEI